MDSAELSEAVIVHTSRKGKKNISQKKERKKRKSASLTAALPLR
jgi:hypothetical protein